MSANPAQSISSDLRQFIAEHIHSIEQLEVLLLLGEAPAKLWSASEVFRQIQSSQKSVLDCLEGFRKAGLVNASDGVYSL